MAKNTVNDCFPSAIGKRTLVMGILNVTPDSFSDGGKYCDPEKAIRHGIRMVRDGADIIDIGGESTRPGARSITVAEELQRVIPVIESLRQKISIPISIDTNKAKVAENAIRAGASIVNDITALKCDRRMPVVVAETGATVILMHMKGSPRTMQNKPHYTDVIGEISVFLKERTAFAMKSGISKSKIIIDPGIGFGKRVEDNLKIIRDLGKFKKLGFPILVGPSRKSFIGAILGLPVDERLEGTLAAIALCAKNGADIVRVHDVNHAVRTVRLTDAITQKNIPINIG
jgi:dihydropteroate synthase